MVIKTLKYAGFIAIPMTISRILHSISQVRDHGVKTRIPDWILSAKDWTSFSSVLDGYHVIKDLSFEFYGIAWMIAFGLFYYDQNARRIRIAFVLAWLITWQVFNLFYHIIWRL